jgi:group I intron endonuclease
MLIYMITCKINDMKYVGQTSESINRRWKRHVANKKKSCRLLAEAIENYGESNFKIELILDCDNSESDFYEKKFIKEYNTLSPKGYNLTTGGKTGYDFSGETKNKISNLLMGHKLSDETKTKIGISSKFRKHSEEAKTKMKKNRDRTYKDNLKDALTKLNLTELPKFVQFIDNKTIVVKIPNVCRKQYGDTTIELDKRISMALEYYKEQIVNYKNKSSFKSINENDLINLNNILTKFGLDNLPLYIYYNIVNDNDRITVRFPNKKEKSWSNSKLSLEEKIKNGLEYLKFLQS